MPVGSLHKLYNIRYKTSQVLHALPSDNRSLPETRQNRRSRTENRSAHQTSFPGLYDSFCFAQSCHRTYHISRTTPGKKQRSENCLLSQVKYNQCNDQTNIGQNNRIIIYSYQTYLFHNTLILQVIDSPHGLSRHCRLLSKELSANFNVSEY